MGRKWLRVGLCGDGFVRVSDETTGTNNEAWYVVAFDMVRCAVTMHGGKTEQTCLG